MKRSWMEACTVMWFNTFENNVLMVWPVWTDPMKHQHLYLQVFGALDTLVILVAQWFLLPIIHYHTCALNSDTDCLFLSHSSTSFSSILQHCKSEIRYPRHPLHSSVLLRDQSLFQQYLLTLAHAFSADPTMQGADDAFCSCLYQEEVEILTSYFR